MRINGIFYFVLAEALSQRLLNKVAALSMARHTHAPEQGQGNRLVLVIHYPILWKSLADNSQALTTVIDIDKEVLRMSPPN